MSSSASTQELLVVRGGLKVPNALEQFRWDIEERELEDGWVRRDTYDDDLYFAENSLLHLFRGVWEANDPRRANANNNTFGFDQTPDSGELVVPAGTDKPVVVMRYAYTPPERKRDRPVEKHTVLVTPETAGSLVPFCEVTYEPRPSSGFAGNMDELTVSSNGTELAVDLANQRPYQEALRQVAADFIDLVS